jgi:DNA-binding transcriptional regulator LsrR (DeoR family)
LNYAPHTEEEIAEHFGLARPVVAGLLAELSASQEIVRVPEKNFLSSEEASSDTIRLVERGI